MKYGSLGKNTKSLLCFKEGEFAPFMPEWKNWEV